MEAPRRRRVASELVLTSFLALFLEMAAVRWFHANVQAVGFFTNLVVISSYLGWAGGRARAVPVSSMIVPILVSFALNTAIFVPFGQALGRRFEAVRVATGPGGALRAYALDILGS